MRPNIDDQRIDEPFTSGGVSDGRPARPAPAEMAGVPEPGRTRLSGSAEDFGVTHLLGFAKF
jgi:hypothetical protein